jgi:hypothetical protein
MTLGDFEGDRKQSKRSPQIALAANAQFDYLPPSLPHQSLITNHQIPGEYPLRRAARLLVVLWSFLLAGGLILAYELDPDPRGFGTHQKLGLPPCSIQLLFGLPCPSCGMTTSFSLFTKGRLLEAARANLAGLLLACFCVVQIPWCWASSLHGRAWGISRPEIVLLWVMLAVCAISLTQWLARLVL